MKNFRFFKLSTFFTTATFLLVCMTPSFMKGQVQPQTPTFVSAGEILTDNSDVAQLAFDVQRTIFINETNRYFSGDANFLVVECVPSQLAQLYTEDHIFSSVQLIKIKINDETQPFSLNLDLLQSFPELKYVWLTYLSDICNDGTDECLLEIVQNSISSQNEDMTIIYSLSISQK